MTITDTKTTATISTTTPSRVNRIATILRRVAASYVAGYETRYSGAYAIDATSRLRWVPVV